MSEQQLQDFLMYWNYSMYSIAAMFLLLGIIMLITLWIRLASFRDIKKKYDFVSLRETVIYYRSFILFGIGVAFGFNSLGQDFVLSDFYIFFLVRFVLGAAIATLIGYISGMVFRLGYQTTIQRKLYELRYTTRIAPKTGNKMRLLSEAEEDVHLDEGMQAEEDVFSIDYDVWVDEETGYVKIERYHGYLRAHKCDKCGFQTLKIDTEDIVKVATATEEGQLIKHYKCTYCSSRKREEVRIAKLINSDADYKLPENPVFKGSREERSRNASIESVNIQMYTKAGDSKVYEFPSVAQAKQFLAEMEELQK